jgi:RNA polymerase sigma factor (sigma-70 family)
MNRGQSNFARVYEENVWRVYGFLAYRLGDRPTAEDLTQTTFERALRAWGRFDARRGSEATWLLAIARNALIDHRRRERPAPVGMLEDDALAPVAGPEANADGFPELSSALMALSERDREVVALRFGGDMRGEEIAAALGLTLANVQQILSRSLRKLRGQLERQAQPLAP